MGKLKFKYLPNYKIKLHKKILTHHSTVMTLNSQQSKMAPRSPTLCFLVFMTLTSQGQMLPAGHAQADPDTPFFEEEPDNITIIAGKKALLRCVVGNVNGRPVQWTFDNFGLGVDRGLSDYPQLRMVGANPQSKSILICF